MEKQIRVFGEFVLIKQTMKSKGHRIILDTGRTAKDNFDFDSSSCDRSWYILRSVLGNCRVH